MRSKLRKYSKLGTPEGRFNYISLRKEYKKPLKRLKMRVGRNLLPTSNSQVKSQNLRASIIAKIMP